MYFKVNSCAVDELVTMPTKKSADDNYEQHEMLRKAKGKQR